MIVEKDMILKAPPMTPNVTFSDPENNKVVGKLEWVGGKMKFTGDVEKSAKKFTDFLIPCFNDFWEQELKDNTLKALASFKQQLVEKVEKAKRELKYNIKYKLWNDGYKQALADVIKSIKEE